MVCIVLYNNGNISCWGVNYSNENNPPEGYLDFFMSVNVNCGIKLNSSLSAGEILDGRGQLLMAPLSR